MYVLCSQGFDCWVIDVRGAGLSEKSTWKKRGRGWDLQTYTEDIKLAIDTCLAHFGVSKLHYLGRSRTTAGYGSSAPNGCLHLSVLQDTRWAACWLSACSAASRSTRTRSPRSPRWRPDSSSRTRESRTVASLSPTPQSSLADSSIHCGLQL